MLYRYVSLILCVLLGIQIVKMQDSVDQCPTIVNEALMSIDQSCGRLGSNEVCYGARSVQAAFFEILETPTFSEPADTVPLKALQRITTSPADLESGQFGLAVMRLQAQIPNTLPGQAVIFVLVGDMSVENDVPPDEAFEPVEPIGVTITQSANLRSGPGQNFNVIEVAAPGSIYLVDAVSEDSQWLRVVSDGVTRWIFRPIVEAIPELDTLPAITPRSFGAMQAFTLTGGVGVPQCQQAPSALLVQSPKGNPVTLNVNGADVTIASTVVFQPSQDRLRLSVINGQASFEDGRRVLTGFSTEASIDPETSEIVDDWQEIELFDDETIEIYNTFEEMPDDLLNYDIELPEDEYFNDLEELLADENVDYEDLYELDPDSDGDLDFMFDAFDEDVIDFEASDDFAEFDDIDALADALENDTFAVEVEDDLPGGCYPGICTQDDATACGCSLCGVECPDDLLGEFEDGFFDGEFEDGFFEDGFEDDFFDSGDMFFDDGSSDMSSGDDTSSSGGDDTSSSGGDDTSTSGGDGSSSSGGDDTSTSGGDGTS